MDWRAWEPIYHEILADFGYDRAEDETARDLIALLCKAHTRPDMIALRRSLQGKEVAIVGPIRTTLPDAPLVATDGAMSWLRAPSALIASDLDGDVEAQFAANALGTPLFLHAHGDNQQTLRTHAASFRGPVAPTTQARPVGGVMNVGGFTDGDRAACLAVHLGARSLLLVGFDLDDPVPKPGRDPGIKKRKLVWARRIIDALGVPYRFA